MDNAFDWDAIIRSLGYLLCDGLGFTLTLTVSATLGGLLLGSALAMMRQSRLLPIRLLAEGYINTIRSLPLLLVIFWFYFLIPWIAQWVMSSPRPIAVGALSSAFITFTLFEAAYFAEIIRSGIRGIARGQVEAALAMGMTSFQTMAQIILPQALRNMTPVLLTQVIILFQDTSLVYVLSLTDLLGAASKVAQRDGRLVEMYLFVAVVYFTISFLASLLVQKLQGRRAFASAH
jgi:glutamate/aspartate transport system permease protein